MFRCLFHALSPKVGCLLDPRNLEGAPQCCTAVEEAGELGVSKLLITKARR